MELDSKKVFDILNKKSVTGLYHANTVRTSKTFLEHGGLLSRKFIEDNGLMQTSQKSDDLDKTFGIWNDIFFDAINISEYFSSFNQYGPILFKFDLELLNSKIVPAVRITTKNPNNWDINNADEKRYFSTVETFDACFKSGNKHKDGGYHIILPNTEKLAFKDFLIGIQIDNPAIEGEDIHSKILEYYNVDLKKYSNKDLVRINESQKLKNQYNGLYKSNIEKFKKIFDTN